MKIIITLGNSQDQQLAKELYLRHPLDVVLTSKRLIIKSEDVINSLFKMSSDKNGIVAGLLEKKLNTPQIIKPSGPFKSYRIKYPDGFISPILFQDEKGAREYLKKEKGIEL